MVGPESSTDTTTGTSTGVAAETQPEEQRGSPSRPEPSRDLPPLRPRELARWSWRQLTSMRTALILLFLLALAAIPGSVVPQEAVDSVRASQWRQQHPQLAPVYERLGLFHVYDSVWFSAIYLLLMVSLVGCIVPRLGVYWRGVRARPPRVPRHLGRLPEHRTLVPRAEPDVALDEAARWLRRHRYRVVVDAGEGPAGHSSVSAERGYLREAGNLLFHLSVLIVLAGFAIGSLWGYRGGVIVVTGDSFANTLSQYDDFRPGGFYDPRNLDPFELTVKDFSVTFIREGREAGMAHAFSANLGYRASPSAREQSGKISVNHPLRLDGTDVFLLSHGYAPHFTVRNADGSIAYAGSVPFLPEDSTFRSFGVVKVTDASQSGGGHQQIGLEGELYPTYAFTNASGPFSAFPDDKNPVVSMLAYRGNLGLDNGDPQSVYTLDKSGLTPLHKSTGAPLRLDLAAGRSATLPDGLGTVTFDGVTRYVKLQVSHTPGQPITLVGVVLALVGLLGSLFVRPRRLWVRTREEGGRTLLEVGGLDRSAGGDLSGEVDELVAALAHPTTTGPGSRPAPSPGGRP